MKLASDPLLRRPVCAAGQPAFTHVSRYAALSGSDREYRTLTGRSGTQRARRLWAKSGHPVLSEGRCKVLPTAPMEGGRSLCVRMPGAGWVGWPGSRSCQKCQQPVIWGLTQNGRWIPISPEPAEDGKLAITDGDPPTVRHLWHDMQAEDHEWLATCHVETCPHGPGPSKPRSSPEKPRAGRVAKCAVPSTVGTSPGRFLGTPAVVRFVAARQRSW